MLARRKLRHPFWHRCLHDGQYEQAVGVSLETRRLDKLEEAIKASPDTNAILKYSLQVCQQLVVQRSFRQEVSSVRALSCGQAARSVSLTAETESVLA